MSKSQHHQTIVNVNNSWETPPHILEEAMKKYDIYPTLDVCATFENNKCNRYLDEELNAFNVQWDEDFFMNPPYSEINKWMERAYLQHVKHNVNALVLVFAKTSTKWWHQWVENKAEIHFQKGRIRFLLHGVEPRYCVSCKIRWNKEIDHCEKCYSKIGKSSPTYDSAWLVFRKNMEFRA